MKGFITHIYATVNENFFIVATLKNLTPCIGGFLNDLYL